MWWVREIWLNTILIKKPKCVCLSVCVSKKIYNSQLPIGWPWCMPETHNARLYIWTWWPTTYDGQRPLMEDNFWWKMPSHGRWPFIEYNLSWKTTFHRNQLSMEENLWWGRPLMEDVLWWKMTFYGRWSWMKDDLQEKMTFDGRWTSLEDDTWWKTTFNLRQPAMEDTLRRQPSIKDKPQWKMTSYREILRFRSAIYRRCRHFLIWLKMKTTPVMLI